VNAIAPARSGFVTVLAMVFIVMSGGSTLIAALQNLLIHTFLKGAPLVASPALRDMPGIYNFVVLHFEAIFFLNLAVSAAVLVVSIGLLKRKRWARIAFIVFMALGIAWNVVMPVLQYFMMQWMLASIPPAGEGGAPDFRAFMLVIRAVTLFFAVEMVGLFSWIIYKLTRPEIAAEFS